MANDKNFDRSMNSYLTVALAGNPNCGKTTIFNRLTGERQAVGNYSGVTVEKVEGSLVKDSVTFRFVDLPGVYSLTTFSRDEVVARDYLLHECPDVIVNVVDASNLERNLFLTLQLKELGLPLIIVLNMCDLAKGRGIVYDITKLEAIFDVPIVEVVGVTGKGLEKLADIISEVASRSPEQKSLRFLRYSDSVESEIAKIDAALDSAALRAEKDDSIRKNDLGVEWIVSGRAPSVSAGKKDFQQRVSYSNVKDKGDVQARRRWLAIKLLENDKAILDSWPDAILRERVAESTSKLSSKTSVSAPIAAKFAAERYANVRSICEDAVRNEKRARILWSDRADRLLTHPFWGLLVFFAAMYLVFWLTFALGNVPVGWLEDFFDWLANLCRRFWADNPDSLLCSLIVNGVIGGVGGVLTFFPNIFILFAAIAVLEESGYMARGAFLTDRFLRRFGLTGKSFIPMLVGFGCSIPAVMSTRIIEDRKSRLSTIFVVPLMSCGARFPIYVLIIPAFFAEKWQAPILWGVYFAGIVIAAVISTVLSVTTFRKEHNPFLIELPAYHAPTLRTVGYRALERGWMYLRKVGTTILGVSIALWFMSTFPTLPQSEVSKFEQARATMQTQAQDAHIDIEETIAQSAEIAETEVDAPVENDDPANLAGDSEQEETSSEDSMTPEVAQLLEDWENNQNAETEARLEYSIVGRVGKAMEPVIKFAGFDWRIGSALIGAFAAKEVFVAQLGIVFKVGEADENSKSLRKTFAENYSPLVGICVIIFCLIGAPCMATLAVVAKETTFRWAFAQWFTLTAIGFILSVVTYQIGTLFHLGF